MQHSLAEKRVTRMPEWIRVSKGSLGKCQVPFPDTPFDIRILGYFNRGTF